MYFVYVIQSVTYLTKYVGSTNDIAKRITMHNNGKSRYTSSRRPWTLIYSEEYDTRSAAMKREKFLKSGQGRKYLDKVLKKKENIGEVAEWPKATTC